MNRADCWCANYRKPCGYHEGLQDGIDNTRFELPEKLMNMDTVGCVWIIAAVVFAAAMWVGVMWIVFDLLGAF